MSTITAILEPDVDGTIHLPLPEELRHGKVQVEATLQAVSQDSTTSIPMEKGTPLEAFKILRKMGGLRHIIPDPVAWQREQRTDRCNPRSYRSRYSERDLH